MIGFSQYCDRIHPGEKEWEHLLYLPESNLLKILSLGSYKTMADYLWIKTVLYLGHYHDMEDRLTEEHHHFSRKKGVGMDSNRECISENESKTSIHTMLDRLLYSKAGKNYLIHLSPLINTITDLDPYFIKPYIIAGYVLPMETGEVKEGFNLLQKGIKYNPDKWELYFLQGFIHLFYFNNQTEAIESFKISSQKTDCPPFVIQSLIGLYQATNQLEMGVHFLEILAEQTEDDNLKNNIKMVLNTLNQ
jgi:hypothetical protein